MRYLRINKKNTKLLRKFLSRMGNSQKTFRYYDNRSIDVVKNHLYTIVGVDEKNLPVCYGHLDEENGRIWLGVCVIESEIKKGLGKKTVKKLLTYAKKKKIKEVHLSVDNSNQPAINLYIKAGFALNEKQAAKSFYVWKNPDILKIKRHIVWLHTHFYYWMGGTKFIYEVAQRLQKNSEVSSLTIVVENTSQFSKEQFEKSKINFISLHSLTSISPLYWIFLPFFIQQNTKKIKSILEKRGLSKENTVVITSMFPMNVVTQKIGYKHIQNCYEPFAFFYDKEFVKRFSIFKRIFIKIISWLYRSYDIKATRNADIVVTLNEITQKLIKDVYKRNSQKTYVGVRSNFFRKYVSKKIANKYKGKKIIIHSTDYSPVKGTDRIIALMPDIVKRVPKAHLLITTTIEDKKAESALLSLSKKIGIKKHVTFLGFVPIKELPQYYSLANVLVQGSFSEKSGTTSMALPVKEAMCCETPAIRPNVGGNDVVNGKSGYLIDPRNKSAMIEKIILLLENDKLSQKMGKIARKDIIKNYTWENTAQVFLRNFKLL